MLDEFEALLYDGWVGEMLYAAIVGQAIGLIMLGLQR